MGANKVFTVLVIWTNDAIYSLIDAWGQNKSKFGEAGRNKKAVWAKIATEISTRQRVFEGNQCGDKWKSLKRSYKRILDNNNSSGRSYKNWKFMDAMDAVMGDRPEIQQISTASSVNGFVINTACISSSDTEGQSAIETQENPTAAKQRRKHTNQDWISEFLDRQDRRHQENLTQRKESTEKFCSLLQKIIDKL